MKARILSATAVAIALASGSASANSLAYGVTGNDLFGVLDLNTGVFTQLGNMGLRLNGLGVGPGGGLYGGGPAYTSPTLFSVNLTNGSLTLVNSSFSAGYYDLGSTTSGFFADGRDGNLYSINPNTGTITLIGPTLLGNFMSTGSSTLFVSTGSNLYSINTTTGTATFVGSPNIGYFDVLAEGSTLYAVTEGNSIYTLNASDGGATFVKNVSGMDSGDFFWGLAPAPLTTATPLPATFPLFATGLGAMGLLGWSSKRKNAAAVAA